VIRLLCVLVLAAAGWAADLDAAAVRADAAHLVSIPDRGQGRPGADRAADWLAAQLTSLGLATRVVLHPVAAQVDHGCALEVDAARIPLLPMGANQAATAGTAGATVTGPLVWGGNGSLEALAGTSVQGAIVVLDAGGGGDWTQVAMLGAAAVIITGDHLARAEIEPLAVLASVPFPRFATATFDRSWIGRTATISGTVTYDEAQARSVVALVPAAAGADPAQANELAVLTAGYEANGAVANPGATRAVNAALLLGLARDLVRQPGPRPVLLVFNGARGSGFLGMRQIATALVYGWDGAAWTGDTVLDDLDRLWRRQGWEAGLIREVLADQGSFRFSEVIERLDAAWRDPPPASSIDTTTLTPAQRLGRVLSIAVAEQADPLLRQVETGRRSLPAKGTPEREALDALEQRYQALRTTQQKLAAGKALEPDEDALTAGVLARARELVARQVALCARRGAETASQIALRSLIGQARPAQVLGLDLSDGHDAYAAWSNPLLLGTESMRDTDWIGSVLLREATAHDVPYDTTPRQFPMDLRCWFPAPLYGDGFSDGSAAAGQLSGTTLRTTVDQRPRLGTPADTLDRMRWPSIARQCVGLSTVVRTWAASPQMRVRGSVVPEHRQRAQTIRTEVRAVGTKVGTRGMPFPMAWIDISPRNSWAGDVQMTEARFGDLTGAIRVDLLGAKSLRGGYRRPVRVYQLDAQGAVTATMASKGVQKMGDTQRMGFGIGDRVELADLLCLMVAGPSGSLFQVFDPRTLAPVQDDDNRSAANVRVLAASRDSEPNLAYAEVDQGTVTVVAEPEARLRVLASHGRVGSFMTLTGTRSADAQGAHARNTDWSTEGLGGSLLSRLTALDAGRDMWRLNDQRLALLRRNGIDSDSLMGLHAQADAALARAADAAARHDWPVAQANAQTGWAIASRVYPAAMSTANDVVRGLVVLLFFAIPFAIICERLFISGATIGRKVAGFTGFFLMTFLFFFCFHPAFSLATTPMVVFLAFLIILMAAWVIGVVLARFELEMQRIRMASLGQHAADVSRLGTLIATMGLGISNMRRRRLRTFLTTSTVVLMTFILLTFASFTPQIMPRTTEIGGAPPYQGILLRLDGWASMPKEAGQRLRLAAGPDFETASVRWLAPRTNRARFPVSRPGEPDSFGLQGVVGVEAHDPSGIGRALVRGPLDDPASPRGLGTGTMPWVFLPEEALGRLGAEPGDTVHLLGTPCLAGVLDIAAMGAVRQIGDEVPTPLSLEGARDRDTVADPDSASQRLNAMDASGNSGGESSSIHLGPSSIAVVSAQLAAQLGGRLTAVSLIPVRADVDIAGHAERLATELAMTVRAGVGDRSIGVTSVGRLAIAGLGTVLVPLVLGGLIIFSTMLNSVAERGREIFIYASLGLAPVHVLALFLVEAGIYAVLGGLGGYMLAQVITAGLGWAATMGWATQPDLNYSSFTAVATILLVMATVLASALYPAWVAAKAANPGTKEFALPDPQGDVIDLEFPFTVARRDAGGLIAFLRDWFEANTDASTGCFTADQAQVVDESGNLGVEARTWLAPFDLGISQRFRLVFHPTDMSAVLAVHVRIQLLSGQRSNWRTANVAFMKALRHQFLVWRTLSPASQAGYRARTPAPASA
jgi:hypothetical protein